jgi:hypothetical protein
MLVHKDLHRMTGKAVLTVETVSTAERSNVNGENR